MIKVNIDGCKSFVKDADYSKYLKKAHMNMLRIELATNDLFHVSSVKQERGLSYPYSRSFNLSVQIGF